MGILIRKRSHRHGPRCTAESYSKRLACGKMKPGPDAADDDRKSYATQVTYEGYLKKWILPRWGAYRLTDVKAVEVEKWLKTLCFKKTGVPLARGSKAKIRNIMSVLYSHAIRWEWIPGTNFQPGQPSLIMTDG